MEVSALIVSSDSETKPPVNMQIIKFNGHTLEMYDSIQELPINRFQTYDLNLLIDAEIGSDISAIDRRCDNVRRLMISNIEKAGQELANMQQALRFVISNTSPKMNSFVVMIYKINGNVIDDKDLTDEGIKNIINDLGNKRLTMKIITDFLLSAKKKIEFEFETFFPSMADNVKAKEFYTKLKQRTLLVLRTIKDSSSEIERQIAEIDNFIMSRVNPKNFHGAHGIEAKRIKGFEQTCIMMKQYNVADDPKTMTTLAFYQALEVIKEQLKQQKRKK